MRTVALEGPCCAGKSACVDLLLSQHGIPSVPEFTDIVREIPSFPPQSTDEVRAAMEHFDRIEKERFAIWRRLCNESDRKGAVILDRSFLSVVAFQEAVRPLLESEIFFDARGFWEGCAHLASPDLVVLLTARHEVLIERSQNAHGGYLPILLDQGFNERFVESVVQQCKERDVVCVFIDTSDRLPAEVVSRILTKLSP